MISFAPLFKYMAEHEIKLTIWFLQVYVILELFTDCIITRILLWR